MKIVFDAAKRASTFTQRGLDFVDAAQVFAGEKFTFEDDREDYGERRFITLGHLNLKTAVGRRRKAQALDASGYMKIFANTIGYCQKF